MRLDRLVSRAILAAGLLAAALPAAAQAPAPPPETRAIERALKLFPQPPAAPLRLIEPDRVEGGQAVRALDAFVVHEQTGEVRRVIYLNRRSPIVANAVAGKDLDIAILAAVIRHEEAHLDGADEPLARELERKFFQSLVFSGRVPIQSGFAYLRDLGELQRLAAR